MGPNSCPTVAIHGEPSEGNPSGVVVINESDFNAETMTKIDMPKLTKPVATNPVVDVNAGASDNVDKEPPKIVAPWKAAN